MTHPGGRPTHYTPELAEKICRLLATNPFGIRKICASNPDLPAPSTIFEWRLKHAEFAEQYARAKEEQADVMFSDMIDIAMDGSNDWYEDSKGNQRINNECVQRSRLIVDTFKYQCERLKPKKYGTKPVELDIGKTFLESILPKLS